MTTKKITASMLVFFHFVAACNSKQTSSIADLRNPAIDACGNLSPNLALTMDEIELSLQSPAGLEVQDPSFQLMHYGNTYSSAALSFSVPEGASAVLWKGCSNDGKKTCYPENDQWYKPAVGVFQLPRIESLEGKDTIVNLKACVQLAYVPEAEKLAATSYLKCEGVLCEAVNSAPKDSDPQIASKIYMCSEKVKSVPVHLAHNDSDSKSTQDITRLINSEYDTSNNKLNVMAQKILLAAENFLSETADLTVEKDSNVAKARVIAQNMVNLGVDMIQSVILHEWEERRFRILQGQAIAAREGVNLALADSSMLPCSPAKPSPTPVSTSNGEATPSSGNDFESEFEALLNGTTAGATDKPAATGPATTTPPATTPPATTPAATEPAATEPATTSSGSSDPANEDKDPGPNPADTSSADTPTAVKAVIFLIGTYAGYKAINEAFNVATGKPSTNKIWSHSNEVHTAKGKFKTIMQQLNGAASPTAISDKLLADANTAWKNVVALDPAIREFKIAEGLGDTFEYNNKAFDASTGKWNEGQPKFNTTDANGAIRSFDPHMSTGWKNRFNNEIDIGQNKGVDGASKFKALGWAALSVGAMAIFHTLTNLVEGNDRGTLALSKFDAEIEKIAMETDKIMKNLAAIDENLTNAIN